MFDSLNFQEKISKQMIYNGGGRIIDPLNFDAYYDIELIRKAVVIERRRVKNGITNEGKNNLLSRFFNGSGTNSTAWSIGLINTSSFSGVSAADAGAGHSGWVEFLSYTTGGSSSLRGSWTKGAASGQQLTNAAAVGFTFTANAVLYGIFLINDSTKGGVGGTLWNTAPFNATLTVQTDDVLNVTYTLQL